MVGDARERREEIAQEAAENAAEIDVLNAEDAEIVAALAEIDNYLAIQEALLADAQQELEAAESARDEALERASILDLQMVDLRADITERSVATYVGSQETSSVLSVQDITDAAVRRYLAEDLTGVSTDLTDVFKAAGEQLVLAVHEAELATADATELRDGIAAQLTELEGTKAAQEDLKAEVDARIAELEADTALLEAEDLAIRDFILSEEERRELERLAAEEAARVAEQERAAEAARIEAEAANDDDAEEDAADGDDQAAPPPAPVPTPTPEPTPTPSPVVDVDTTPGPSAGGPPSLIYPLNGPVVSGFGNRVHPVYGTYRFHAGLDIDAPSGANIWAAGGGTVIFAGWRDGYGNTVIVDHGGGYTTLYAHMSSISIGEGALVGAGTMIGLVGQTGLATGAHCHFEVRINGEAVDPAPYMP